jgi:hypothetical protein
MQPAIDTGHLVPESATLDRPLATSEPAAAWSPALRVLFRFTFSYLVLYNFPFPLAYIPYVDEVAGLYFKLWNALVPWVGKHVFHVDASTLPNGSGDTTYNYVQVFCYLVIAGIAALVWSLLDRKHKRYERLQEGLRIYIRFALGAAMISYGTYKVVQSQFPAPSVDRLLQPLGDASPMGLLWTFMGASTSYNVFTGLSEMIGGLLLTFRRTTLLGALVSIGVMANVVMLNFSYDVPVKLYSSHLLAMAIFLTLPDLRRLIDLFVLNRRVQGVVYQPFFQRPWLRRGIVILRTVLVVAYTAFMLSNSYANSKRYGKVENAPLYGIWNVDELTIDGQPRPPLVTDPQRWRRVIFNDTWQVSVQLVNDSRDRYYLTIEKNTLKLTKRFDPNWAATLTYAKPQPGLLTLEGMWDGHKLAAKLHREPPPKFLLTTRGFHWINERPFNR